MAGYVRYIEKTRQYYDYLKDSGKMKEGAKPYQWASNDEVPFAPLKKALAQSRIALISTGEMSVRGEQHQKGANRGGVYSLPASLPADQLYSSAHAYDKAATTLDDVGSYYPTAALHEAVKTGRIAGLTPRFHNVYNAFSKRCTVEVDAVEVLDRCREDGADAAVLVPICPLCHQTIGLVSRVLEENGIPTVVICTARDIVESCGVARMVHVDFPLGNPCGEPYDAAQQREIVELGFKLLERAFLPRTAVQAPFKWSKGDAWKSLVFSPEQPF